MQQEMQLQKRIGCKYNIKVMKKNCIFAHKLSCELKRT